MILFLEQCCKYAYSKENTIPFMYRSTPSNFYKINIYIQNRHRVYEILI